LLHFSNTYVFEKCATRPCAAWEPLFLEVPLSLTPPWAVMAVNITPACADRPLKGDRRGAGLPAVRPLVLTAAMSASGWLALTLDRS